MSQPVTLPAGSGVVIIQASGTAVCSGAATIGTSHVDVAFDGTTIGVGGMRYFGASCIGTTHYVLTSFFGTVSAVAGPHTISFPPVYGTGQVGGALFYNATDFYNVLVTVYSPLQ